MENFSYLASEMKYHALALIVVAIWGITFVCTKVLIGAGLLPAQIFAIRFAIAYLGIWLLCCRRSADRRLLSDNLKDEAVFILLGISGGSFYFLTENTALAHTQACNVSFIVCSAPLITAIFSILIKKSCKGELADSLEDISGRWQLLAGTVLALCGMAAVTFDGNALEFSAKGDLLALCSAFCWGIYSIFMGRMTVKYGSLLATRKVFFYGLLTIIPFIAGRELDHSILLQPQVLGNLLFLSVLASLVCFVLWNKAMVGLGNITATNYVYLNPLFTLFFAMILLGERLTVQSAIGCAAILIGVVLSGMDFHHKGRE